MGHRPPKRCPNIHEHTVARNDSRDELRLEWKDEPKVKLLGLSFAGKYAVWRMDCPRVCGVRGPLRSVSDVYDHFTEYFDHTRQTIPIPKESVWFVAQPP